MCQGCRTTVSSSDGSIPAPPFNLVIARAERQSFRDESGVIITPYQEQTCHYHIRIGCVRNIEPTFVPMALKVPQDILPLLSTVHIQYLKLAFGLNNSPNVDDVLSYAQIHFKLCKLCELSFLLLGKVNLLG